MVFASAASTALLLAIQAGWQAGWIAGIGLAGPAVFLAGLAVGAALADDGR